MKNFPHQINQIHRLTQALSVFRDLIERGQDISDDGVVGDALARAGVYTFREKGKSMYRNDRGFPVHISACALKLKTIARPSSNVSCNYPPKRTLKQCGDNWASANIWPATR